MLLVKVLNLIVSLGISLKGLILFAVSDQESGKNSFPFVYLKGVASRQELRMENGRLNIGTFCVRVKCYIPITNKMVFIKVLIPLKSLGIAGYSFSKLI